MSHVVRSARPENLRCHRCRRKLRANEVVRERPHNRTRKYPFCPECARYVGVIVVP